MRIYNTSEKYTKWIILLFLSLSISMPFVELSVVRIGFGVFESNIVNSFILTILVGFLFLLNPIIGNRGLLILSYIIFKGLHGVVNGADIGGVYITLITFLLIFRMYIFQ